MVTNLIMFTSILFTCLTIFMFLLNASSKLNFLSKPPMIDLIVSILTIIPWFSALVWGKYYYHSWKWAVAGLAASFMVQIIVLEIFNVFHSLRHRGPSLKINQVLGTLYGSWHNRLGLWI